MKFFIIFFFILCFQSAFSEDITPIKKKKKEFILVLKNSKASASGLNAKKNITTKIAEDKESDDENVKINLAKYDSIFKKKSDWNTKIRIISKDIEEVKQLMKDAKNEDLRDYYEKNLYELKFRRAIINLQLKNYGKAIIEGGEVVAFDESYLFRKPVLYFDKKSTFDDTMSSAWYLSNTLEKISCKDDIACKNEVSARYSASWYRASHDYENYNSEFFNNNFFADVKTVLESYMGLNRCVGTCLIGRNIDSTIKKKTGAAPETSRECDYFEDRTNLSEKYKLYLNQLNTMTYRINDRSSTQVSKTRSYLCRGFTNVMMLELGYGDNKNYIANAKSDIKNAISLNNTLSDDKKIDEVDDIISLDMLVKKYNEIATKGMNDEEKALAKYAISEQGLKELKDSLNGSISDVDEFAQISENLTDEQKADIASAYAKYSIADVNGDEKTQTGKFLDKSTRMTHAQMEQTDVTLQEMLDAIIDLQQNGDL